MGLYKVSCRSCNKEFNWFSGNEYQICSECLPEDKQVQHEQPYEIALSNNYEKANKILKKLAKPTLRLTRKDYRAIAKRASKGN